jgi:hypothetical protein
MTLELGLLEPPSTATMVVVLLGASEYPQKPAWSNPVLRTSAHAVRDYVLSPTGLALAPSKVLDLFDDGADPAGQLVRIKEFLSATASIARDLVLYYVGHGGFYDDEYHLGVRSTRHELEYLTTIESKKLAQILRDGFRRKRVYVFLDSCFAASAASDFQGDEINVAVRKMSQSLPPEGTVFLAAASKEDVAHAPRAERYTVFTGAVLEVLTMGVDSPQPKISMYELFEEVRDVVRRRETDRAGRPELHVPRQREGDVSRIPVFPNATYTRTEASRQRAEAAARVQATEYATARALEEANARALEAAAARKQMEAAERAVVQIPTPKAARSRGAEIAPLPFVTKDGAVDDAQRSARACEPELPPLDPDEVYDLALRLERAVTAARPGPQLLLGLSLCGPAVMLAFNAGLYLAVYSFIVAFTSAAVWNWIASARMRPVLDAVIEAPERVVLLRHLRGNIGATWIELWTADRRLIVKATKDWHELFVALRRRCPTARVVGDISVRRR